MQQYIKNQDYNFNLFQLQLAFISIVLLYRILQSQILSLYKKIISLSAMLLQNNPANYFFTTKNQQRIRKQAKKNIKKHCLPSIISNNSIQSGKTFFKQVSKFQISSKNQKTKQRQTTNNTNNGTRNKLFNYSTETIQKTFVFQSSDFYIKRILIEDGWKLCSNLQTNKAKLKWITLPKKQHFNNNKETQFINHFKNSYKLTTKLGLYKLISSPNSSHIQQNGANYLDFYPRSYDLSSEYQNFQKDFLHTSALNLMKKLMIHIELVNPQAYQTTKKLSNIQIMQQDKLFSKIMQNIQKKQIFIDHSNQKNKVFKKNQNLSLFQNVNVHGLLFINLMLYFIGKFSLYNQTFNCDQELIASYSKLNPPYTSLQEHFCNDNRNIKYLSNNGLIMFFHLYKFCLKKCKWFLNDGLNNIWIVKANEGSRGRNIFLVDNLQAASVHANSNRIIQKYIENVWIFKDNDQKTLTKYPFLNKILHKKFDIRLWVLVKSFSPLIAYIYDEGYLRISFQKYQLSTLQSLKTHLTNFKINYSGENQKNKEESYVLLSDFLNFLHQQGYKQKQQLKEEIQNNIKNILYSSLITYRSESSDISSFQLYGFDVILDHSLKPWILECNMSPSCNERGHLKKISQQMGRGLLNIMGLVKSEDFKWKILFNERKMNINKNKQQYFFDNKNIQDRKLSFKVKPNDTCQINKSQFSIANLSKKNHNDFRSTFAFNGTVLEHSIQTMDPINLQIVGEKFKYKKNEIHQNLVFIYGKVVFLQLFFKNRYKNKTAINLDKTQTSSISKCMKMVEKLAILYRLHKKYWFKKLRKYISKTLSKNPLNVI